MAKTSSALSMTGGRERSRSVVSKRVYLTDVYPVITAGPQLSKSQAPSSVGSRFTNNILTFRVSDLDSAAVEYVQRFDCFRITAVDVYANITFIARRNSDFSGVGAAIVMYVAEDLDCTSFTQPTWATMRNRSNLRRLTFQNTDLTKKIASIKPRPTFSPTDSSAPSALTPKSGTWVDTATYTMEHAGLEIFTFCPISTDVIGGDYTYQISYEIRMEVEVKGGI